MNYIIIYLHIVAHSCATKRIADSLILLPILYEWIITKKIPGALLIYCHPLSANAPTLMEHINSFSNYSKYNIWSINSMLGFPHALNNYKFNVIVLHYSIFGFRPYVLNKKYLDYIESQRNSVKIAFFQDEHRHCVDRFEFINKYNVDVIYSLLEPKHYQEVYLANTNCNKIIHTLTGYVDDDLIKIANRITKSNDERSIDIGYRARPLSFYMGKGAQEKTIIAEEFIKRTESSPLNIDIETAENKRIYGHEWHKFVSNCRAMIGVEAGVSIFDIEDKVQKACDEYLLTNPSASFDEVYEAILKPWEDNIYYRTISPRVFECAAFRVCMILFEGRYNNILEPMIHYIPLKKDFSNFDQVIELYKNKDIRRTIVENAYKDLIASGKYSYQSFVIDFDKELGKYNISTKHDAEIIRIEHKLQQDKWLRIFIVYSKLTIKNITYVIRKPRKSIKKLIRKLLRI